MASARGEGAKHTFVHDAEEEDVDKARTSVEPGRGGLLLACEPRP